MKNKKFDMRAQLEAGMAVFLSEGKTITRVNAKKQKGKRKIEPKVEMVEIEVEFLPEALRSKHFGE